MKSTDTAPFKEMFLNAVHAYMEASKVDFGAAWEDCKAIHRGTWQAFQNESAHAMAANEKAAKSAQATPDARAEASAEFQRRVNERMRDAGENFGAAWAFVSQTQPRLYARMNGNMATDAKLAEAGHSEPTIRK